jgi:hypothetical protein
VDLGFVPHPPKCTGEYQPIIIFVKWGAALVVLFGIGLAKTLIS